MATDLFQQTSPTVPLRALHLDLKGLPPTPERLVSLLDVLHLARYNAVLVEWEDTFPWTVDERFRGETFYSPETVDRFHSRAAELGIEIIPLVQCLGHMETPLGFAEYARLREVPERSDCLNPLAPGAPELVQSMVDDVVARTPGTRYFHLGGDEAWAFGSHPDTKAYIEAHGKAALYLHYIEPLLDSLNERGIRPILWHDMMKEWSAEALQSLGQRADLMIWGYRGTPDNTNHHHRRDIIERMAATGIPLWGAGAFKCGEELGTNTPPAAVRRENMLGWADAAKEFDLVGVCATGWSRNCTVTYQYAPIDSTLNILIETGVILHDGESPRGGLEACVEALAALGDADAFRARRDAVGAFEAACKAAWDSVRMSRQFFAGLEADPRRLGSGMETMFRDRVGGFARSAVKAGAALPPLFEGLVPAIWIERLVAERVRPLEEEADLIKLQGRRFGTSNC